jgi:hypothetical protein
VPTRRAFFLRSLIRPGRGAPVEEAKRMPLSRSQQELSLLAVDERRVSVTPVGRGAKPKDTEHSMNKVLLGLALALGIGSTLHPATAAQYGLSAPQALSSSVVEAGHRDSSCRRLRRACEFKYERGEVGEGNCRRYRRECGRY